MNRHPACVAPQCLRGGKCTGPCKLDAVEQTCGLAWLWSTVLLRAALVAAGVGIMYFEGQHRPDPGVGFAIAMILMLVAVVPWRSE